MTTTARDPIGVFDSGVGGLSVLCEIRRELPGEDLLYVADSKYAPYGDKPAAFIEARGRAIAEFLLTERAKAIVVASNTGTAFAAGPLRSRFALPVIAIEPAVKPAAAATKTGVVGVMATSQLLVSEKFLRLVETHSRDVNVLAQACPGLVERVEAGDLSGPVTRALVERYVRPLIEQRADTILLGCTHYPFLLALIREVAGPDVAIIDPAIAVARETRRRLAAANLLAPGDAPGAERFWTSGDPAVASRVINQLWSARAHVDPLPRAYVTHVEVV